MSVDELEQRDRAAPEILLLSLFELQAVAFQGPGGLSTSPFLSTFNLNFQLLTFNF